MKARDMSAKEYEVALARNGLTRRWYMGYVGIGNNTFVCALNAGPRRRDQLAYLLRERERVQSKQNAEAVRTAVAGKHQPLVGSSEVPK